jgi:hypothetical protein
MTDVLDELEKKYLNLCDRVRNAYAFLKLTNVNETDYKYALSAYVDSKARLLRVIKAKRAIQEIRGIQSFNDDNCCGVLQISSCSQDEHAVNVIVVESSTDFGVCWAV